jgi:MoxR-like ATPase
MPSIRDSKRLVKRVYLTNLVAPRGLSLTPMLVGPHGIGKTQIIHAAAKELGGYSLIVEGGSLKEGEITGLPFASANKDGSSEVRFIPYYQVSNIMKLEREYFIKAVKEGFLKGEIKIVDGMLEVKGKKIVTKSKIDSLVTGEVNDYKFGDELDAETKLKLIESGEIKPIILFIDELNRTEPQVMKELMNILLTRSVNGYVLPWWVSVVAAVNPSSQNSVYATNEMDDAQRDRFLKISVEAKIDEWVDYALDAGMHPDVVASVATAEDIFIRREKGHEDQDEMSPSPRSWEMVGYIYSNIDRFNNSKLLNNEDKKHALDDIRTLIAAKVGPTAARTFLQNIENKELNIKPSELINGKTATLDEAVVAKFLKQKRLRQKITVDNVVRHIASTVVDFENKKKSTDVKEKKEYVSYKEQIKAFVEILDDATKIAFAKRLSQTDTVLAADGKNVFGKIADCFATNILQSLMDFEENKKSLDKQ